MARQTVLIVAPANDIHALAVARSIRRKYPSHSVHIVDGADFPSRYKLRIDRQRWVILGSELELNSDQVISVWWRRPGTHRIDDRLKGAAVRSFVSHECVHAFDVIAAWDEYLVVNRIESELLASRKPYQFRMAHKVGLQIPSYVISNDEVVLDECLAREQLSVFKTLTSPINTFGETRLLNAEHVSLRSTVDLAPVIFQDYVRRKREFRVTIIGKRHFTHEIQINNPIVKEMPDWRLDVSAQSIDADISAELLARVYHLMKTLRLSYGALDFIEDESGQWHFLEVNPHGQFLFNEADTGAPMAEAMADLLVAG